MSHLLPQRHHNDYNSISSHQILILHHGTHNTIIKLLNKINSSLLHTLLYSATILHTYVHAFFIHFLYITTTTTCYIKFIHSFPYTQLTPTANTMHTRPPPQLLFSMLFIHFIIKYITTTIKMLHKN